MTASAPAKPRAPRRKRWHSLGGDVCDWIETHCVLPSGDHIGEPFVLMAWQRKYVDALYTCDARGALRYRWSLLGVPKGNGKSPLASALALYHLLGDPDESDPWVVVAAAADKQADIVFDGCKRIAELSPTLNPLTIRYRGEIRVRDGKGKLERVAAAKGKLDGKLISFLVIDELHEWLQENWIILTGGAMKRARAQIVQITTAGWDQESICYREYAKGRRIESGEEVNESYLFRWYGAPDGADHREPTVWETANPSWGTLVHEGLLADLCRNIPESQFRRYRLNQWVESEELWLPAGSWEACGGENDLQPRARTWVAWDASTKHDSTAIVAVQGEGELIRVQQWTWERPRDVNGNPVEEWVLPIAECEAKIRALCEAFDVQGVGYDPAFITWSADELAAQGLPMEEFPQSPARMCPATAALYEAVVQGRIAHGGDPTLARHIRAVRPRNMRQGGQMLEKVQAGRKIDAAIALVMAVGMMVKAEEETMTYEVIEI